VERGGYLQRSFFRPPPLGHLLNQLSVRGWSKKKRDEGRRGGGRSAAGGIFSHSVHRAGRAAGVIVLVLKVLSSRELLLPMLVVTSCSVFTTANTILFILYPCKEINLHSGKESAVVK
jgi:hypothetical protein